MVEIYGSYRSIKDIFGDVSSKPSEGSYQQKSPDFSIFLFSLETSRIVGGLILWSLWHLIHHSSSNLMDEYAHVSKSSLKLKRDDGIIKKKYVPSD